MAMFQFIADSGVVAAFCCNAVLEWSCCSILSFCCFLAKLLWHFVVLIEAFYIALGHVKLIRIYYYYYYYYYNYNYYYFIGELL